MRKWTKTILLIVTIAVVMTLTCVTAFAAESDVIDESFSGVKIPSEDVTDNEDMAVSTDETVKNSETDGEISTEPVLGGETDIDAEPDTDTSGKADDAFSIDGNGEVLDNVMDEKSGKEFYTITTANNNVFYLIIDHSSNTKNVYMLSMIDENDLKEFLSEEAPETPDDTQTPPSVNLDDKSSDEPGKTDTDKSEKKSGGNVGTYIILAVLAVIVGGGAFYFKIYKPKKEARLNDDEDMEGYIDEGETVNEDETFNGEVNADTSIDELAFDDEEE